jgi:uncharacterized protein YbbK (DUF523 family)
MLLVSACLAGYRCRYDGKANANEEIIELVRRGEAIPFCPEQMGGLPTPRSPSEIVGEGDFLCGKARVLSKDGRDCSEQFLLGAQKCLEICRLYGIEEAILKARSPSCGCGEIYDGSFSGRLKAGDGVTAALLKRSGIRVQAR